MADINTLHYVFGLDPYLHNLVGMPVAEWVGEEKDELQSLCAFVDFSNPQEYHYFSEALRFHNLFLAIDDAGIYIEKSL